MTRTKLVTIGALLAFLGATIPTMPGLAPEWATWLDSVIRAGGVFLVYVAGGVNPDGTPAKVAYRKD